MLLRITVLALLLMQLAIVSGPGSAIGGTVDPSELYRSTIYTCLQPVIDRYNDISGKKMVGSLDQIVLTIDDVLCVRADNIDENLYEKIRNEIEYSQHKITRMVVSSPGGDAKAAIKIGWLIRDQEISVFAWGLCLSSCANYIFLAAQEKYYGTAAGGAPFIGFHGAPRPIEGRPSPVPQMHLDFFAELGHTDEMTYRLPCNLRNNSLFNDVQNKMGRQNIFWMFPPQELEAGFGVKGLKYNSDFSYPILPGTWQFPGVEMMPVEGGFIGLASCPESSTEGRAFWRDVWDALFGKGEEARQE